MKQIISVHDDHKGFTLGELLVVIAIMTILVAVAVGAFTGLIGSGKSESAKYEKEAIQSAIESYMSVTTSSTITARSEAAAITKDDVDAPFVTYLRRLPTEYEYKWDIYGSLDQEGTPAGGAGGAGGDDPGGNDQVALWHLDEMSGASAADSVGSNHGTIIGATHTTGISGRALDFDGINDYVEVADAPELRFGPEDSITIETWIKPDSLSTYGVILQKGGITNNDANYVLRQYNQQLDFFYRSTDGAWHGIRTNGNLLELNQWSHIAITHTFGSPSDMTVYVDGSSVPFTWNWGNGTADPQQNSQTLRFGGINNWGQRYSGTIDEVTVHNQILSAAEVLSSYNSTKGNEIAMWHLDENNGTAAGDSIGSNDGTINGATWTTSAVCGSALSFDGNDFVEVGSFPNLQTDFTITAWIYTTDNTETGQRIFADDENNTGGYAFSLGDPGNGALRFYSRDMDTVSLDTSNGVIQNNQWHFVTAVTDISNESRYIYVDGILQASDETDTGTWGTDNGEASIGGETASGETQNRFMGIIDDVRIHNTALTQTQIQALFDALDPS